MLHDIDDAILKKYYKLETLFCFPFNVWADEKTQKLKRYK